MEEAAICPRCGGHWVDCHHSVPAERALDTVGVEAVPVSRSRPRNLVTQVASGVDEVAASITAEVLRQASDERAQLRRQVDQLTDALTAVQARCTQLLNENRALRGRASEMRVRLVRDDARMPTRGSDQASGLDLYAATYGRLEVDGSVSITGEEPLTLFPGQGVRAYAGIAVELPIGHEGQIRPRSSTTSRGLSVSVGTIDNDYRGEIAINLWNISRMPQTLLRHERLAQLVIAPVSFCQAVPAEALSSTARGENGFGSTGR